MTLPFSLHANTTRLSACALCAVALILAAPAHAAQPRLAANAANAANAAADAPATTQGSLDIAAGKGTLVRLNEDATSVFVADPAIADVHVPSPRAVFVLGKKAGTTTLYVLGANNKTLLQRSIVVGRDMDALRSMVSARFPSMNLQLSTGNGSLQVSGQAANAADADAVVQSLTPYLADKEVLVNRMTIDRPQQVQLRVRITEVDRNVTQQLGINWQAMGNAAGNFFGGIYSGRPDL